MTSIGVGIVGFWHVHAADYAHDAARHPATRVVAGWDADPQLGNEGAAALGIPFEESLDALLARPDVDAVTITTATADHTDVIGRALRAGKHVFSEKLLAPTAPECEALIAEASARGLQLVVSLPRLSEPVVRTASRLIDEGALGTVTYARVRMAHDGWLAGWLPERFGDPVAAIGGAFADLGCHPAYLVQLFLGPVPQSVSATYGAHTGHAVEDNAVVVAGYENGAVGVAEASFVTTPGAFALELRGTRASLLYGFGGDELIAKGDGFGDSWTPQPLDAAADAPFDLWADAIRTGSSAAVTANLDAAVALTRFVLAANASASDHRIVAVGHN